MKMKKFYLMFFIVLFPLVTNAQYGFNRHKWQRQGPLMSGLIRKADRLAYERACNDSIYTREVMLSYLDYKRINIDEVSEKSQLKDIFKRVVTKGKKFKDEDRNTWKQEFYYYEFDKIMDLLKKKVATEDSLQRYDWSGSDLYLGLKMYCLHGIPEITNNNYKLLEKYNVDIDDIYRHYIGYYPFEKPTSILQKLHITEIRDKSDIDKIDFQLLHNYMKNNLKDSIIKNIYGQVLKETGYLKKRDIPGIEPSWSDTKKINALYEKDKNSANVIELEALYTKWNRMVSDYMWEKYALANNKEFNAACVDLNNALEYRKTHPLEGGVIRETIKISDTNHVIKEIPYKVLGDELVADGTCILNFVDEQYKNANGDWYKKYTMNVKVIIKVENGIAISKSFSGIHKVWSPDKKVWDRTKGGFLEKTANTLDAKPVVVKTNDMSKIENPSIIISQDYINEYLRFSYERDVSISHLCKEYLKNPTKSQYYLNVLKMPLRPIDTSKIKLVVK